VIVGWLFDTPAYQSLPRDLTLGPDASLRQAFVSPFLKKTKRKRKEEIGVWGGRG
jgi:hypothetical protein